MFICHTHTRSRATLLGHVQSTLPPRAPTRLIMSTLLVGFGGVHDTTTPNMLLSPFVDMSAMDTYSYLSPPEPRCCVQTAMVRGIRQSTALTGHGRCTHRCLWWRPLYSPVCDPLGRVKQLALGIRVGRSSRQRPVVAAHKWPHDDCEGCWLLVGERARHECGVVAHNTKRVLSVPSGAAWDSTGRQAHVRRVTGASWVVRGGHGSQLCHWTAKRLT